jgi:hypothetical protein
VYFYYWWGGTKSLGTAATSGLLNLNVLLSDVIIFTFRFRMLLTRQNEKKKGYILLHFFGKITINVDQQPPTLPRHKSHSATKFELAVCKFHRNWLLTCLAFLQASWQIVQFTLSHCSNRAVSYSTFQASNFPSLHKNFVYRLHYIIFL